MMSRLAQPAIWAFAVFLALVGGGQARAAEPVRVLATFSVLGDMAQEVGGDLVQVTTLVGPGGDAHVYQPTPADAKAVARARLVVVNGLGMEGWLERLIKAAAYKGPVVVASQGVATYTMQKDEGSSPAQGQQAKAGKPQAAADPHAWQDLTKGQAYVRNIAEALAKADPAHADAYRQRANTYIQQLAELDAWVRAQIGQVPAAKRRIITSHDAFGYFGAAYGVSLLAPVGINTDSEPTAAGVAALVQQIKQEGIKSIFIEYMTDARLIEQIARESGAQVGESLFSDSLSPAGGPADTYVKMFRHNVPAMTAAMLKN